MLDLIKEARGGDQEALATLLAQQQPTLRRLVAAMLLNRQQGVIDPDDVLQEAFIRVLRKIESCQAETAQAFRRWIVAIAANTTRNAIRHQIRYDRGRRPHVGVDRSESLSQAFDIRFGPSRTASSIASEQELKFLMSKAMDLLPPHQRAVLILRSYEQMTLEQIAAALGKTTGAVKGLQRRAVANLKMRLDTISSAA